MSHIRVEVDGHTVIDRDVDNVEGTESNGHFTMTADWEPEARPVIDAPTRAALDEAIAAIDIATLGHHV